MTPVKQGVAYEYYIYRREQLGILQYSPLYQCHFGRYLAPSSMYVLSLRYFALLWTFGFAEEVPFGITEDAPFGLPEEVPFGIAEEVSIGFST